MFLGLILILPLCIMGLEGSLGLQRSLDRHGKTGQQTKVHLQTFGSINFNLEIKYFQLQKYNSGLCDQAKVNR